MSETKDWAVPQEVIEYLVCSLGCYDMKPLHNRRLGVILDANSTTYSKVEEQRIIIKITVLENTQQKEEFKREVKLHKLIQRTNKQVCKLYQSKTISVTSLESQDYDVGIMLLEKMNTDLMEYLFNVPYIPPNKIKGIFKAICHSVLDCHQLGLAHLDLKPENILLNFIGRAIIDVKLCDLECARLFTASSSQSEITKPTLTLNFKNCKFGTTQYLPPESVLQSHRGNYLMNLNQAEKVDVYALGTVLFVMISRRFPKIYNNEGTIHCLVNDPAGEPESYLECLLKFNRACTYECAELISRMMHNDPIQRPSLQDVLKHPFFS